MQAAGGMSHSVALRDDGTVVAWGDDSLGQCAVPTGLWDVRQVAAGARHSMALGNDGTVLVWGDDWEGQCDSPPVLSNVLWIAAGGGSRAMRGGRSMALAPRIDCDDDGQRDGYQIGRRGAEDENANGRLDACEVALGDLDLSECIDNADLALLLLEFGPCPACPADLDDDGEVSMADAAMLLLHFGPTG
ncbi:MAG: hypothetical protein EBU70_08340 [Actinobacteria bacterium]|nr:hypothetical protein [Actinomycetota bacterium]